MKLIPSFFLLALVANLTFVHAQNTCDDCVPAFDSSTIPPAQAFCGDGDPLQQLPTFPDFDQECSAGMSIVVLKYTLGETAECAGSSASGLPMDLGAFHLEDFTATGLTSTSAFYPTGEGMTWTVYPQNLARLQGTIANANNVGAKFDIDFYFNNPTIGSQWIAGGENLNTSSAIGDAALDWNIWQIKPGISKLVGRDDMDGELILVNNSVLDISYPFQEGDGGNTVSEVHGLGGSFDWVTCVEGTVFGGYGSTALDLNGCSQEVATCASDVDAVGQYFLGNLNHFDQIEAFVDIVDETPPHFQEVPLDYTLNCPVDLNALDAQNSILVSDACSSFELDTTDQILPGSCPNAFTRVRTFTATDGCGLSSQHVQTIEVRDEFGPTLMVPGDVTFDCSEEIVQLPATAVDDCDGPLAVTESPAIVVPGGCPGEYTIYREFTVEDLCGNAASGQQTIQVRDQTPPEITLPPDVVLPCGDSFVYPEATAVDNCTPTDSITWAVFNSLPPTNCPQEYILERTFLATDQCGNSVTATQTVTVTDLDLPYFDFVPEDYSISCDEEAVFEDAVAKDDCSSFIVEEERDTVFLGCPESYDLIRTFVVTDACGNLAEAEQIISVRDDVAPTILSEHPDETIECSDLWVPTGLEAEDQCSDISWAVISDTIGDVSTGSYQIQVTLIASDACGNASSTALELEVLDTQAPIFLSFPEDMELSCEQPIPFENPLVNDLCSATTTVYFDTFIPSDTQGVYTVERTFVSTDAQGNSVEATQTFSVFDQVAPAFSFIPNDYTSECSDDLTLMEPEAFDNCAEVNIVISTEIISGNAAGNYLVVRTFTATDDAGNSSQAQQTINVVDSTAPEFTSVPSDYTSECSEALVLDDASAADNCGEVTIEVASETILGNAAGNYTVVRTFTATDDAGNSSQAQQTINVVDTTAPEFIFVPSENTSECSEALNPDDASASDNCGEVTIEVVSETISGNAAGNYTVVRTFTATDDAGNSSQAQQTINVVDTTAPEFTSVPSDYTSECSEALVLDDASATDNCGEVTIEVASATIPGNAAGNYTVVRTFTATDDAGNSSQAQQTITVQDTTGPQFTFVPSEYTSECSEAMVLDDASATDNCGEVTIEVASETIPGNAAGNYTVVRTFTATDDAGNSSQAQQTINVVDTTAPEFTSVPSDYTSECSEALVLDDASASDNCGEVTIEVASETILGNAAGNYTVVRTFTATDDAGNSSQAQQTINVVDTTAPEFIFVPSEYTSECSEALNPDDASASDNCGEVTIEVVSETISGNAAGNYTVVRTFTATDDAGNSSQAQQTINVVDTTAPEFTSVPSDYTSECSEALVLDDASATDNCGEVTIEVASATIPGNAAGNYTVVRTFTATDDAGNSSQAQQTINVVDTTAPQLVIPEDYTIECSQGLVLEAPEAEDNCGSASIATEVETIPGNAAGNYTVVRTFTATDDAGNSSQAQQTITVQDTTSPEFTSVPSDYTSECSEALVLDNPVASDNCGEVSIELASETIPGNAAGNYTVVRTFTATDDAGNSAVATQTITVVDTTAPELSIPDDYTSECSIELIFDDATASDNCGEVTIEVVSETIPGNAAGNYTIVRTFTATDDAGNSSQAQQTINVEDTTAPELVIPEDYTSECSIELFLDDASATDNCGEVTIEVASETIPGNAAGNYTVVRTFTATDDAGNSSQAQQTITVEDTTAPELVIPEDYTIECSKGLVLEAPEAEDNCGSASIATEIQTIPGNAAGNYTVVRTFTATDDAGNSAVATQTINVVDTTAPELVIPDDYTSECSEGLVLEAPQAEDNCGSASIATEVETIPGNAAGNYTVVRTFTATDDAGNSAVAAQTITVVDTTAPELIIPDDYTSECSDALIFDDAMANDNCGPVTLELAEDTIPGDAEGNYTVVRTFTATDDAGNIAEATQTITVEDTTAPEFTSVPADLTSECSEDLSLDDATASDNCGEVTIEVVSETILGNAAGNYTVVRTFTASDDAGNSSQAQQTITVEDTTAPELVIPEDYTSECSIELILENATATDNCGEVTIEVASETIPGNAAGNYTVVRTFTATDDAGNSSQAQQTITVEDTTAPIFVFFPSDANVECDLSWPEEMPEVADNCGTVLVELETDTLPGICGELLILERTFTATDDAGNVEVATQRLTQVDTTSPVIEWQEFVDLACSQNLNNIPLPSVSDACSDDVTLIWNDEEISGGCTLPIAQLLRTYTAFDQCGNTANAVQVIQLTDNEAPVWTSLPEDLTIECTDTYEVVLPTFTDNCATPSLVWSADTLGVPDDGFYEVVFTFIASDDCDNVNVHAQTLTVVDSAAPVWTSFPEDQTITCTDPLDTTFAEAEDGCSQTADVSVDLTWEPGVCEGSGVWTRTFTATDASGNEAIRSQSIEVVDVTPPSFLVVPMNVTLECDQPMPDSLATATDDCSQVTVTTELDTLAGINGQNFDIVVHFEATDACGNSADTSYVVTFEDTTPPAFTFIPEDFEVDCSEPLILEEAQANDNCSEEVTIAVDTDTILGVGQGNYTLVRTFTATDPSSNALTSDSVQTIVVVDHVPPAFSFVPADITIACDQDLPTDLATAEDLCGTVTVEVSSETTLGSATGNYTVVRTFVATDDAGNAVSDSQIVTVQDLTPPMFLLAPTDTTVACTEALPVAFVNITDDCGIAEWMHVDSLIQGDCSGNNVVLRTFTAWDDAGNEAEHIQTIQVIDSVAPVFTFVPDTTTWECNAPAVLDSAVAIDNCSGVTLTAQLDTLEGQEGIGWDLQVTWLATDDCGNANSAIQVIEVLDGLAPSILVGPADAVLPLGAPFLFEAWQSEIVAEDGCTPVENLIYSHEVDTLEATEPCVDMVAITWSVTDLAGNHSEVEQMVQLNDNDAPQVTGWPLDLALTCEDVWVPVLPEALDDNPFDWSEQLDTLAGACPSDIVIQRTLVATDVCGNATSPWVQSISFVDSVAPVVTEWPQDLLLQDVDLVPDCEQDSVVWMDNCNDVNILCTTDTIETYCPGSMLLERTYDVMDACGNATAVKQSILVEDVQPPSWLNFPEDVVVGCDSLLEAFPLDSLMAMDNASSESELVFNFLGEVESGDDCIWEKTYTYALQDGCGNGIENSYTVTWQDTLAPSLLAPLPSLELFCTSEIPACEDAMVEAEDLCNDWSWSCEDNFEGGDCTGPDCVLLRQITLTDACGNARTEDQTMVISEPPTVPELPTGFSPNNDNFNDLYLIRNAGPELGIPPCDWLTNTTLTVYDRWGSVVYESNDVTQPWDGTNLNGVQLPVGTYFVVFDANGTPYRASVDLRR